jgi:CARDB
VSGHDDDILDFDFFEDDATREAQQPAARGRRLPGSGGGPRLRPPGGATPLLRLIGVVAFAIVLVVLLAVWIGGCSSDRKRDDYSSALAEIGDVGAASAKTGADLAELLTTPGLTQDDLEAKLGGIVQKEQQNVQAASSVDVPGPLRPSTEHTVEALGLRVGGTQGLLDVFVATKNETDAAAAGELLAAEARRLDASDVVWQDLFREPAQVVLEDEGLGDLTAPPSVFVQSPDLYTPRSLAAIWQRVHGASTGGSPSGLHGTGLAGTTVLPAGVQLSTDTETTIEASTQLAFEVGVTNTGESQEVQIEVTLTIPKQPKATVKNATIDLLDVGETKTVTFRNFPDPPFGEKTTVQVSVKPVPGETNTGNNSAEYPVIFSLG